MIDKQFIGYEVPPTLWDVEKGRIRFFAEVIGATDPIYFDASAAQAAGYRNVVAPPTFIFGAESDTLRFQTRVSDIYDKKGGALEFVVNDTKATNQLGEHVSDLHSVIVVRHA